MHKICNKYAVPHNYASYEKICKNMQKMQLYARYANMIFICKICTPHFAYGGGRVAVVREIHQVQKARGNICRYMQILICTNMQKYAKWKYALLCNYMLVYALYT